VEIEKTFLVLNSNENGTIEMSDVRDFASTCYLLWYKLCS